MEHLQWWSNLRHGGLLLDLNRLNELIPALPPALLSFQQDKLRREISLFVDDLRSHRSRLISHVLEHRCGFGNANGTWHRGGNVAATWTRRGLAGEAVRPSHLWLGHHGASLPVFIDDEKRLGIGRSKRSISHALQWLRQGPEQLAIVTNGQQWRLIFAGLDYDAFVEWELDQWLAEGGTTPEFDGLRALITPELWTPPEDKTPCPLLAAINDSRKGQSDLSQLLGERVRQAAELLIQGHAAALNAQNGGLDPQDIYRAGVRMIMRMVIVFFAESREGLLPRDNPIYHGSYSLQGLRTDLERTSPHRLATSYAAFPRILALFRLIYQGCSHEALPVPCYGGELFAPGDAAHGDGMHRALRILETACFDRQLMNDNEVRRILDLLSRTEIRIRQGRTSQRTKMPVDFSALDSEYIGILYEGLLDFELRSAPPDQPVVFLAVGNQPALPLATLEGMDDGAIANLLEKLKKTKSDDDDDEESGEDDDAGGDGDDVDGDAEPEDADADEEDESDGDEGEAEDAPADDARFTAQARAEQWAQHACEVAKIVKKPRGKLTPEKRMQHERKVASAARQLVTKVVLPGEWYLVRWGGTRKGSGTFYTRPQLAIPTVHRTLRPLAYDPPAGDGDKPNLDAPAEQWNPKRPEEILALKVCDPACGSGSFCLAALRFLTDALYRSLMVHKRIRDHAGRAVLDLIFGRGGQELLVNEPLPCRPEDDEFEPRTRAILRRYVVERCIYGVDLDPLAVELCRLSLWIETLDRSLPLTFLNHKIKCGNSLVGAWFDQFPHYPVMAWDREGGDKNHTNGVHFEKQAWTRAVSARKKQVKTEMIEFIDHAQLLFKMDLKDVRTVHEAAERALEEIHELGIHEAAERAEKYEALQRNAEFVKLKEAFDLWCALWFWPPEQVELCPLPEEFYAGQLVEPAQEVSRRVAAERRFFHWELEFPDVFNLHTTGFDAVLGNPPWDIAKPSSKEFFSAVDPLYRSYGKQDAIKRQSEFFEADSQIERNWLEYCAFFKAMSNWVKYAGYPFGDRVRWKEDEETGDKDEKHDFNLGDRGRGSFATSSKRHARWKQQREESTGLSANQEHPFRHQGSADLNSYKMFLEQAHALLRDGGRLGLIVPSGLYSDHGTGDLRELFLEHCQWEWLFGFENREKVFDIDSRFKFNPVIVIRGGNTVAIRTAFMRRQLADWERAEEFVTLYPRERVLQFSPKSRALLEIQSQRDLEVLTKIYSNSVLLGDQGPDGWGIRYAREFDMTNDSKLFPPRPKWEEWGYRPDEYSRWVKGPWKPIAELWDELRVDPTQLAPFDTACAAKIEAGIANGEVGKTDWHVRCAQPPYDTLPVPRADIPEGIILSREADAWIREEEIPVVTFTEANGKPLKIKVENEEGEKEEVEVSGPAVALPLYEGRMIGQFDFSEKGWVSGKGRSAEWREIPWENKQVEPQYLLGDATVRVSRKSSLGPKIAYMRISSSTNSRTMIATYLSQRPAGDSVFFFLPTRKPLLTTLAISSAFSSFAYDYGVRFRLGGLNMSEFVVVETTVPRRADIDDRIALLARFWVRLLIPSRVFAPELLKLRALVSELRSPSLGAPSEAGRLRIRCAFEAITAVLLGMDKDDFRWALADVDWPSGFDGQKASPKGFWRVDKGKHPEHRLTVLALIAFHDLEEKIAACGGDVPAGIEAFCNQNDGEGWVLPETLRLADYGLGHDDRAKEHQPVRSCFSPRFYDWQLAQTAEESWRECHLHARNLLGEESYQALLREIEGGEDGSIQDEESADKLGRRKHDGSLIDIEDAPLFQQPD